MNKRNLLKERIFIKLSKIVMGASYIYPIKETWPMILKQK